MFSNRSEAGRLLAEKLGRHANSGALVLGIPRGGVVVAAEVAKALHLPLSVFVVRKLGAPGNPELAIGAVANDGAAYWNDGVIAHLGVGKGYRRDVLARESGEVRRRLSLLGVSAELDVKGRTVILVDDGIATGATMKAGIRCLRKAGAKKIIVAVPVCPPDAPEQFAGLADDFVCLERPVFFAAVGQFYADFPQVTDVEVKRLLSKK
ncbi:MAG: phosphoribosyltransferase family protein [Candidatus Micrarchaeota archaeon]